MAKGGALGGDPAQQHRKHTQRRDAKRNKDARDKMREVAVLYKDTGKMERKIEQFRSISQTRRMTAAERERLSAMEAELKDVLQKQKEAGIAPVKRNPNEKAVGFDPLAEAEDKAALVQYASSAESSDGGDGVAGDSEIGVAAPLDYDMFDADRARKAEPNADSQPRAPADIERDDSLPPMPPGTPPLLPEDSDSPAVWPPLPSGPSPLYLQANPHAAPQHGGGGRGRGQGRGRGRGHSRGRGHGREHHDRRHPAQSDGAEGVHGARVHPYAPRPHAAPTHPSMPGHPVRSAAAQQRAPPSATVLSAEPQVRDLKKELTTLVPSAIARRGKQKERQRVLAAVPAIPAMVVNAAPDVAGDGGPAGASRKAAPSAAILGAAQRAPGARTSEAPGSGAAAPKPGVVRDKGSLDEEYRRFMDQMDRFL
ncbi:hypothetical protein H4R21_002011 [Coemansia helicoidea]|uniref:Uncharacterized protein n=1 Tax=Coemansia helicoidea TaxID=1286919 RepID=A0ACC1LAA9_9FUNG|nr:hypothetical protein H4R21_002011 [Coemansia helicoidea]